LGWFFGETVRTAELYYISNRLGFGYPQNSGYKDGYLDRTIDTAHEASDTVQPQGGVFREE